METVSMRSLPHWYMPNAAHFVTYRLAGTLSTEVLNNLKQMKNTWLNQKPKAEETRREYRERIHKSLFLRYDRFLAESDSVKWLADPRVAAMVRSSLYYLDREKKGRLLAYCIMPNHMHIIVQLNEPPKETEIDTPIGEAETRWSPLAKFMHSLKSFTAHEANTILGRAGEFWQHESYDHWVRDDAELQRIVDYIAANPITAGLVLKPQDWFWCSAHDRYLQDAELSGWLNLP